MIAKLDQGLAALARERAGASSHKRGHGKKGYLGSYENKPNLCRCGMQAWADWEVKACVRCGRDLTARQKRARFS